MILSELPSTRCSANIPLTEGLRIGGTILINSHYKKQVNLISDKVIVSLVLELKEVNNTFSDFSDNIVNIKTNQKIEKNFILDNLYDRAIKQDKILKSFLAYHENSSRNKRQILMGAALLGTLAGFGINEGQILNLQNRLTDLNNDHIHLSSKVNILEDTIEYNSIELKNLKLATFQSLRLIKKSLTDIDVNFVKVSNNIKELKSHLIQLAASVSSEKLLNNNNKVLRELAELFNGWLDTRLDVTI